MGWCCWCCKGCLHLPNPADPPRLDAGSAKLSIVIITLDSMFMALNAYYVGDQVQAESLQSLGSIFRQAALLWIVSKLFLVLKQDKIGMQTHSVCSTMFVTLLGRVCYTYCSLATACWLACNISKASGNLTVCTGRALAQCSIAKGQ